MLQRDSLAMTRCTHLLHHVLYLTGTLLTLLVDVVRFLRLCLRLAPVLAAENLFLHKQLALYQERQARPKHANAATRMAPVWLSRVFDWRAALVIVQPATLIRWHLGLRVLKTPAQRSVANAICERVIGTLRQECLDFVIPLNAGHLYSIFQEWAAHYNEGRPHMSLGPGIPQPPTSLPVPLQAHRHQLPEHLPVVSQPILGGVHHAYALAEKVA